MEKSCGNCAFYIQYYLINRARLLKADCGHCNSFKKNGHRRKAGDVCEVWEEKKPHDKTPIENSLRDMSERLADILYILKTEK